MCTKGHTIGLQGFIKFPNFVRKLPMNCLTVFDHFVKLALKGLRVLIAFERIVVEVLEAFSISI